MVIPSGSNYWRYSSSIGMELHYKTQRNVAIGLYDRTGFRCPFLSEVVRTRVYTNAPSQNFAQYYFAFLDGFDTFGFRNCRVMSIVENLRLGTKRDPKPREGGAVSKTKPNEAIVEARGGQHVWRE